MNAKELRLGNFVKDRGKKVIRIDFLEHIQDGYDTKFGQLVYLEGTEVHPMTEYSEFANPIPLTEEWLIKLGFGKSDDHVMSIMCVDDELSIEYDYHFNRCFLVINAENNTELKWLKHIQYVHQLQNIYFALTGEDLTTLKNNQWEQQQNQ